MVFKFIIQNEIMKGKIVNKGLRTESWSTSGFRSRENKEKPGKVVRIE